MSWKYQLESDLYLQSRHIEDTTLRRETAKEAGSIKHNFDT